MTLIKPTRRQDQTVVLQSNSTITVDDLQDNQIGINQESGSISFIKVVDNQKQLATVSSVTPTIVHNNTTSRQGGNSTESYHLTEADYTDKILNRRFGTVTDSNYSEFELDGTLKMNGTATVYEDVFTTIASGKTSAVNQPSWESFTTNTSAYTFAVNDFIDLATIEVPHSYKEGSDIEVHLHLANNGVDTNDRAVKFIIYYTYAYPNSGAHQFSTEASFTQELVIPANTLDKSAFYLSLGTISDTNIKIGTQIKTRIKRVTATGTAPTNNPFLGMIGFHYISDTIGSRIISAK